MSNTTTSPPTTSPAPAQINGSSSDATSSTGASKVQASDVGWQFVPQYYTFINNSPQRLHCFYNKKSTFIHGVEGEEVKPCYGQQEIHQKILSLNFQDCKAYIHSIDSQSSAAGGIIIQVIGEMSNASGPWRKFTQTFFLAEQPNGYFVMNDIFRYLKEEGEDEEEVAVDEEIVTNAEQAVEQATTDAHIDDIPAAVAPAEAPVVSSISAPQETVEVTAEPVPVPAASEDVPEPAAPVEAVPAKEATPEPTSAPEAPAPAAIPAAAEPVTASTPAPAPAATKAAAPTKPAEAPPAPAAAAPVQPPKPAGPKTWASLAASKSGAWGTALASKEAVSTPAAPAPAPAQRSAAPQPSATESAQHAGQQQQQGGQQRGNASRVSLLEAAQQAQTAICFVKLGNWQNPEGPDSVDPSSLRNTLSRYGEIVDVQIVKNKACAFVDFKTVESARKAIIASLSTKDGGEGGIRLSDGARITVEARKEKEERGKGAAGTGSGGLKRTPAVGQQQQQQQAGEGGDRGGFVQRGGKGGRVGRGKATGGAGGERQPAAQK